MKDKKKRKKKERRECGGPMRWGLITNSSPTAKCVKPAKCQWIFRRRDIELSENVKQRGERGGESYGENKRWEGEEEKEAGDTQTSVPSLCCLMRRGDWVRTVASL